MSYWITLLLLYDTGGTLLHLAKATPVSDNTRVDYVLDDVVLSMSEVGRVFIANSKDHYEELLGIDEVQAELAELEATLRRFSASSSDFDVLDGVFHDFRVSRIETGGEKAHLDCLASGSRLASLKVAQSEVISSATTLLLSDKLIVTSKSDIKCDLGGEAYNGLSCAETVMHWSRSAGKLMEFPDSPKLYTYLVAGQPGDVFRLGINSTHVLVSRELRGYALCTQEKSNHVDFKEILEGKYFSHMGHIALKMTTDLTDRIAHAEMIAYHLVSEELAANGKSDWIDQQCKQLYVLKDCIGSGTRSPENWNFFGNRRQYVIVDESYRLAGEQLVRQCAQREDVMELATSLLAMRSLHIDMSNIRRGFGFAQEPHDRLLLARSTTDADYDSCLASSMGVKLSSVDRAYTLDKIYGAKLRYLQRIGQAVNVGPYMFGHKVTNVTKRSTGVTMKQLDSLPTEGNLVGRVKRGFTDFLSAVTGLGTNDDIVLLHRDIVREDEARLRDEAEILKLDKKSNEILLGVQEQSRKVGRLWDDENKLHDSLTKVISDEKDTLEQMSHLSRGLEASSDIAAEFTGILLAIERLHDLTADIEDTLSAVMSAGRLVKRWPTASNTLDKRAIRSGSLALRMGKDGISVVTSVDSIVDEFVVYDVRILPILVPKSNLTVHFDVNSRGYGVNSVGYVVELGESMCNVLGRNMYCRPDEVTIRVAADNCVEEILTTRKVTGSYCKQAAQVGVTTRQEYVVSNNQLKIYAPAEDKFTIYCNGTVKRQGVIQKGVTVISIPDSCRLVTSQVVSYGSTAGKDVHIVHVTEDLIQEIAKFQEDLEDLHDVNLDIMQHDIQAYGNFTNMERMDLDKLNMSVTKFMAVKQVEEYTPFHVDLEKPAALQNHVSGLTVGVLLFALLVFAWVLYKSKRLRSMLCCCFCAFWPSHIRLCKNKERMDRKRKRKHDVKYDPSKQWTPLKRYKPRSNSGSDSDSPFEDFNKHDPNGDSTAPRDRRRKRIPMNRNKRFYSKDPESGRVYYIDPQGGEYYLDEHDLTDLEDSDADAKFTANMKSSLAKDLVRFRREGRRLRIEASKSQECMDHVEMRRPQSMNDSGISAMTPSPRRDEVKSAVARDCVNNLLHAKRLREEEARVEADVEAGTVRFNRNRTVSVPNLAHKKLWVLDESVYKQFDTSTAKRRRNSTDDVLEDSVGPEVGDWVRIRVSHYRLVLMQDTGVQTLYFDYYTNKIVDAQGRWVKTEPYPDERYVTAYIKEFKNLPVPEIEREGNIYVMKDNPSIRYSTLSSKYTSKLNGDLITGIRRPILTEGNFLWTDAEALLARDGDAEI